MKWIKQHWLLLLLLALLLWAIYKADKALASAIAIVSTILTALGAFGAVFNPISWIAALIAWLAVWLWGGGLMQSLYQSLTGTPPQSNDPAQNGVLGFGNGLGGI